MINTFVIAGTLRKVTVVTPKDKSKLPSAILMVQYGVQRELTGNSVEFANVSNIRVPSYKYAKVADKLIEQSEVSMVGHLQGVIKEIAGEQFLTTELVMDTLTIEKPAPKATVAAATAE